MCRTNVGITTAIGVAIGAAMGAGQESIANLVGVGAFAGALFGLVLRGFYSRTGN
jgi:hypothetical protein